MADKIISIDSKYRNKHYANGFFSAIAKSAKGGGIAIIICGIILALIGGGILAILISSIASGGFNAECGDIFGIIFGLIFFVPGILCIWFGIRRGKMNDNDWIKKFMESSDYPESVIRDFGNQVLEEGSLRMQLGTSGIQGFLTRDYICICNLLAPCVIKIEDILGAYFVEMSNRISVNGKMRTIYDTNIAIFSNHKTQALIDVKEKTYKQIIEILKQKNPSIDIATGRMLSEKEYNQIKEQLCN
ncbi:MAG: hypothetical protein HDR15_05610 [Lachnospiraceae bacterium]|nr:hypothetical protein [Lachnospiraceae bacterium]